jgi:pimeloyl-ACP methyl ester carboxylesterase
MTLATINDIDLFFEVTGCGQPLVLVHGSWGDHTNWDPVVTTLAAHFQVITYDRRGHSGSASAPGPSTTDDDVADLAALIEHVVAHDTHVVGNSFGASIALRLVQSRPELARSVTVHEPPLFHLLPVADDSPDAGADGPQAAVMKVLDLIRLGRHREAAQHFVDEIALGPGSWDRLPSRTQDIFESNAPTWAEEQADPSWDVIDPSALDSSGVPLRITYGTDSPPPLSTIARRLVHMIPRAELVEFPGAGHIPHVTHPDMYCNQLRRHLASMARPDLRSG